MDQIWAGLAKDGGFAILLGIFIWQKFAADKEDRANNRDLIFRVMAGVETALKDLATTQRELTGAIDHMAEKDKR